MTKEKMQKIMFDRIKALEEFSNTMYNEIDEIYQKFTGNAEYSMTSEDKVKAAKQVYQPQGGDLATTTLDIEHINIDRKCYGDRHIELIRIFEELFGESVYEYERKQEEATA